MIGFNSFVNGIAPSLWSLILIGISATRYIFYQYLDYRQYKVYERTTPPAAIKGMVEDEKYTQSQAYGRAHKRVDFFKRTIEFVSSVGKIYFNVYRRFWNWAGVAVSALGFKAVPASTVLGVVGGSLCGVLFQLVLFYLIDWTINTVIRLPMDICTTFGVEERFGFNNQTPWKFVQLKVTGFLVQAAIQVSLIAGLLTIVNYFGDSFVPYATMGYIAFLAFMFTISGPLIDPLFMKRTPLGEGELRNRIAGLADSLGFPMDEVYVLEGSSLSSHGNAHFTGMPWKMLICLYDTLIDQLTELEILAVMAHEMCHWKRLDELKMLVETALVFLLKVKVFEAFIHNTGFYAGLGFPAGTQPVIAGLYLFSYVGQINVLTTFIQLWLSRLREYQADQFAKDQGYGDEMCLGLIKTLTHSLEDTEADWLYSLFCYSHPLLMERLNALKYKPKVE